MTRKHFEDLAQIIRVARKSEEMGLHWDTAQWEEHLIVLCMSHNTRFDAKRFRKACTPEPMDLKGYVDANGKVGE